MSKFRVNDVLQLRNTCGMNLRKFVQHLRLVFLATNRTLVRPSSRALAQIITITN